MLYTQIEKREQLLCLRLPRYRQTPNNLKQVLPTPSGVNHLLNSWL